MKQASYLLLAKLAALIACENKFSPIRLLNFLAHLNVYLNNILTFALKNIEASFIFLAHLNVYLNNILAFALKNIEVNFMFLAHLNVYLQK